MPPQATGSVKVIRDFVKQNKANIVSKNGKKPHIAPKHEPEVKPPEPSMKIKKKTYTVKTKARTGLVPEPVVDESAPPKFAALSPNMFRKTTFVKETLQKEIKIPKIDRRRPSMRFDPAYNRNIPIYMDIPDLYAIKKRPPTPKDPFTKYRYVVKVEVPEEEKARYVFIPRPKTPKNYLPRPKSSNRYVCVQDANRTERYCVGRKRFVKSVFKPKERYMYKPRPSPAKNFKPRPKSGKRYKKRYSYPTQQKTVFKFIGRYKYEPRPPTPKNHLPRPKSGDRYVYERPEGDECVPDILNPYKRKSIFKPQSRYSHNKRPKSVKNYNPKPKSSDRYITGSSRGYIANIIQ